MNLHETIIERIDCSSHVCSVVQFFSPRRNTLLRQAWNLARGRGP